MLRACAVECLLKALLLMRGKTLAREGQYDGPQHHKLVDHADKAGFSMTAVDRYLLERLSLWNTIGRYPIPLGSRDWFTTNVQGLEARFDWGSKARVRMHWGIQDEAPFEDLLARLHALTSGG